MKGGKRIFLKFGENHGQRPMLYKQIMTHYTMWFDPKTMGMVIGINEFS
jgi:hypothetical protein